MIEHVWWEFSYGPHQIRKNHHLATLDMFLAQHRAKLVDSPYIHVQFFRSCCHEEQPSAIRRLTMNFGIMRVPLAVLTLVGTRIPDLQGQVPHGFRKVT